MKIYIVMGTTGEYSDRSEWVVKAFDNENMAKEFIKKATKISDKLYEIYYGFNSIREYRNNATSELDPKFELDYTGTQYFYYETELVRSNND